jgi:hypothetical protein
LEPWLSIEGLRRYDKIRPLVLQACPNFRVLRQLGTYFIVLEVFYSLGFMAQVFVTQVFVTQVFVTQVFAAQFFIAQVQ